MKTSLLIIKANWFWIALDYVALCLLTLAPSLFVLWEAKHSTPYSSGESSYGLVCIIVSVLFMTLLKNKTQSTYESARLGLLLMVTVTYVSLCSLPHFFVYLALPVLPLVHYAAFWVLAEYYKNWKLIYRLLAAVLASLLTYLLFVYALEKHYYPTTVLTALQIVYFFIVASNDIVKVVSRKHSRPTTTRAFV